MIRSMIRMGMAAGKDVPAISEFIKDYQKNGKGWKQKDYVQQSLALKEILFQEHKEHKGNMIGPLRKSISIYCSTLSVQPFLSFLSIQQLTNLLQLSNIVDHFKIGNTSLRYKLMSRAKRAWEELKSPNESLFHQQINLAFELAVLNVSAKRSEREKFAKRWMQIKDKEKTNDVMRSKLISIVHSEPMRESPQYRILMTVLPMFELVSNTSNYPQMMRRLSQIQNQPFFVDRPLRLQFQKIYDRGMDWAKQDKLELSGGGKTGSRGYAAVLRAVNARCWAQMRVMSQNNSNFTAQDHGRMLQNLDRARCYSIQPVPLDILKNYLAGVPNSALINTKLLFLLLHGFFDPFLHVYAAFLKERKEFITLRSLWYLSQRGVDPAELEYQNQGIPKGEKFLEWAVVYGKKEGKQHMIVLEQIRKWIDSPQEFYRLVKSVSYAPVLLSFHKHFSHLYLEKLSNPFDFPLQNQEKIIFLKYLYHTTPFQTLKSPDSKPSLHKLLQELDQKHRTYLFGLSEIMKDQNHLQIRSTFFFQLVRDYFSSPGVSRNPGLIYNIIDLIKKFKEIMDVQCIQEQMNQVIWDILYLFINDHINLQSSISMFQYIDDFIGIFLWRGLSNNYKAESEYMFHLTTHFYHFRSKELQYQIAKKKLKMGWLSASQAEGIAGLQLHFTQTEQKLMQIVLGKEIKLSTKSVFVEEELAVYFAKPEYLPRDIDLTNIPELISSVSAPVLQQILTYEQLSVSTHPASQQLHQILYKRLCDPELDFEKINCHDLLQKCKDRRRDSCLNGENIMKAVLSFYQENSDLLYKNDREVIQKFKNDYGL